MSNTNCVVDGCKTTIFNKKPGVVLYSCPVSAERRRTWLKVLKNRCSVLDWTRSKICSRHFENKHFDNQKNLKINALPTLFPLLEKPIQTSTNSSVTRTKVDRLLNKLTQAELMANIQSNISSLDEPTNLSDFIGSDYNSVSGTPTEGQLWLLVKKQEHLNTRLMETIVKNKENTEASHKNLEEAINAKKDLEKTIETYKYMIKCLQEKHSTLEEQVEILSSIESR